MQKIGSNTGSPMGQQSWDEAFERRLDQALAEVASPSIPPEFAARVAALVPARQRGLPAGEQGLPAQPAYGRYAVVLCAAALLVALLLLAPHVRPGSIFAIALEWILCAQLSLLALYIALPGSPWRSAR